MVGVPCLAAMWRAGPSSRIGCPFFCLLFSQRITAGPKMKLTTSAVMTAPPVRKVR